MRPISTETSTPSTVTPGCSHDRTKSYPNGSFISCPAQKQTQGWTGKAMLYMGPGTSLQSTTLQRTRGSALPSSSHTTWLPWPSPGPRPRLPTHLPPWLQITCHPLWPWQPTPAMEELTSSGHRDSRPAPPKRPEKPSAVPPPPRDSDKAPDEITTLRPQEEAAKSFTSLPA